MTYAVNLADYGSLNPGSDGTTIIASGGKWVVGANNGPAIYVYRSAPQTLVAATATAIGFDTELFDTASAYNTTNFRFTPTIPGYYSVNAQIAFTSSGLGATTIVVYLNGVAYSNGFGGIADVRSLVVSTLVPANGSTDYIQIYASAQNGATITVGSPSYTYFNAIWNRSL